MKATQSPHPHLSIPAPPPRAELAILNILWFYRPRHCCVRVHERPSAGKQIGLQPPVLKQMQLMAEKGLLRGAANAFRSHVYGGPPLPKEQTQASCSPATPPSTARSMGSAKKPRSFARPLSLQKSLRLPSCAEIRPVCSTSSRKAPMN